MVHLLFEASPAATYAQLATAIVLIVGAVIAGLRGFGVLKFGNASDWAAELELTKQRADRLAHENDRLTEENARLHQTRSVEPLIKMLTASAEMQNATLEKLAAFNGTLRHIQDAFEDTSRGLREATDGLGVVVALLQTLHDLPVVQRDRGRNILEGEG